MLGELQERFFAAGNYAAGNALIRFEREVAAGLDPTHDSRVEALHDALAVMRRASDVLADYPEHETLTQSLRASCRKAFEALPHRHGSGADTNSEGAA